MILGNTVVVLMAYFKSLDANIKLLNYSDMNPPKHRDFSISLCRAALHIKQRNSFYFYTSKFSVFLKNRCSMQRPNKKHFPNYTLQQLINIMWTSYHNMCSFQLYSVLQLISGAYWIPTKPCKINIMTAIYSLSPIYGRLISGANMSLAQGFALNTDYCNRAVQK